MTSRSSDAQSQSMQPHDVLALANRFVERGASQADLSFLLSSASDLIKKDITGDKAKASKKSDLATYTPNQVPSSSSSAPKSPRGTMSAPTSPTATIRTSTAPLVAGPPEPALPRRRQDNVRWFTKGQHLRHAQRPTSLGSAPARRGPPPPMSCVAMSSPPPLHTLARRVRARAQHGGRGGADGPEAGG